MAETVIYALYVDWNNDGDYGDAGEDISADWISVTISRGFNGPLARFPSVGRMTVNLKNTAQTYSPPATAAARPRRLVRFTMAYDGDTVTLFEGLIESIRPDFGTTRSRRAVMECVDRIAVLDRFDGAIAVAKYQKADDIIGDVIAAVYTPDDTNYEVGIHVFPISSDQWIGQEPPERPTTAGTNDTSASDKIQDACVSDWGRFFIAKDGTPTFYNRHHAPLDTSTELTLDDTMLEMGYQMSVSDVYNVIEVTCHPRNIGQTYEVLSSLSRGSSAIIEAGEDVTFDVSFRDPSNNAIQLGGDEILAPVANVDFVVTDDEPGAGADKTSDITPGIVPYGTRAEVTLANGAAYPVYLQSLQVRGKAVRTLEPVTLLASDATSITAYGKRKLQVDAVLLNEEVSAQGLSNYLLDYYKDPLHDVRGVTFYGNTNATLMEAARDLELLDKVVLTESQTGLSSETMFIYAMRHNITPGKLHQVSVDLEQAYDTDDPFIIESSLIGGTDVIIY